MHSPLPLPPHPSTCAASGREAVAGSGLLQGWGSREWGAAACCHCIACPLCGDTVECVCQDRLSDGAQAQAAWPRVRIACPAMPSDATVLLTRSLSCGYVPLLSLPTLVHRQWRSLFGKR
eukprot:5759261-Pyramimonas_sp.AAC.1